MEKCYSLNNEEFNHTELDDAIRDKFDDLSIKVGDIVTVIPGTLYLILVSFWPLLRCSIHGCHPAFRF